MQYYKHWVSTKTTSWKILPQTAMIDDRQAVLQCQQKQAFLGLPHIKPNKNQ
jgi:hypothetical protein